MLRRHGSVIVGILLVVLVATACLVRTGRPVRRGAPPQVERHDGKHKPMKHKKTRGRDHR